jgi:hypothetical protein
VKSLIRPLSLVLSLLLVANCGSNRLPEPSDTSSATHQQTALKARLEQVLFDQIVKPPTTLPVDEALISELRMNRLEQIESSVDTALLRADQRRLLDGLRWVQAQAIDRTETPGVQAQVGIEPWLHARLQRLQQAAQSRVVDPPNRSQRVGEADSGIQQFLNLVQEALLTQAQLNPLDLDYLRLDPLLIKPTLLPTNQAFFYQETDSSIRINRSLLPHLAWADAEIIALTQGLPGHHFLDAQNPSPNWFPEHARANRSAMSLFLLERLAQEPYYQTIYSETPRLRHLTLTTLIYLKAVDDNLTLDFFRQSLGELSVSERRLEQAFHQALNNRQTLISEAEALRDIERAVFIQGRPTQPEELKADARARLATLIQSLDLPLQSVKL